MFDSLANPLTFIGYCSLAASFAAVTYFDFRRFIIPNWINVTLLLIGLALASLHGLEVLLSRALTAVAVAAFFYGLAFSYARFRNRQGLGMGDVKFIAAASTWLGIIGLPWMLLIASCAALVHALILNVVVLKVDAATRIPFGPYLAMGLLLVWHSQNMDLWGVL